MQAETVETLIKKSKFEPDVALGVAESIDMAITSANLVTVQILDARMAALEATLDAKLSSLEAHLVNWVLLVMLGNVALGAGTTAIINYLQHAH
jgi:hypothetical protein